MKCTYIRKAKAVHLYQDMYDDELSVGLFGLKVWFICNCVIIAETFTNITETPPSPQYPTDKLEKPEDNKRTTENNSEE